MQECKTQGNNIQTLIVCAHMYIHHSTPYEKKSDKRKHYVIVSDKIGPVAQALVALHQAGWIVNFENFESSYRVCMYVKYLTLYKG